jgi:SpoVK/Ycf46/Vps4 family AAA+-type ATPase
LWSQVLPLPISVPGLGVEERMDVWRDAVDQTLEEASLEVLSAQPLTPEQIHSAVDSARALAHSGGEPLTFAHVRSAVRAQNAAGLGRLARRIDPAVGWDDLVLPEPVVGQLRELASRALHRDKVLGTWSMRPGGGRGHGVTALFAGDSGTGKTMSAEALAAELGLDLYVIDLSRVVDKYIGETEKNLDRIFAEAAGAGGVLLFDEADAIFGKRSEVHDSHDRYANLETAYLLQRMESFDGIAILTTNLQANLDEAFTRRLDAVVEFPLPDRTARRALWDACLGPSIPRDPRIDLTACARFDLTGGAIRSCVVTAAYRVAREGRAVRTADLVDAVRAEYRKLGRLVSAGEFEVG